MNRLFRLPIILVILAILAACSREKSNPELSDPIYLDLVSRASTAEQAYENQKKHLEEVRESYAQSEPRTLENRRLREDVHKAMTQVRFLDQERLYYNIRAKQRKAYGRRDYRIAYSNNEEWPRQEEYAA